MSILSVQNALRKMANPKQAALLQRFFKTGKGEYGEGDMFLGIKVPAQRKVVAEFKDLPLVEAKKLLVSRFHEHRLVALLILVKQFERGDAAIRKKIFDLYLANARRVNNWDLVDLSAPNIVGVYLLDKPRAVLYKLVKSKSLWERRIAVLATFAFIREGDFQDALKIAHLLLRDPHDLIHKAVGWMLREVGKKDQKALEQFLKKYSRAMPRTMLRYAIEKFPEKKRQQYLRK